MQEAVYLTSPDGRILDANEAMAQMRRLEAQARQARAHDHGRTLGMQIELAPGVEGLCHISELDRPEGQSLFFINGIVHNRAAVPCAVCNYFQN